MQEQRKDGRYGMPRPLDIGTILGELGNPDIKRFFIFPTYTEDGKPTKEVRRAWRRYRRNPIK